MTTPTGPIDVEITAGEPEIVEVTQAPSPGLTLTTAAPSGSFVTQAPAPGLTLTTAGPQGPPGTRLLPTVGQPSDSLGYAGEYAIDTGSGRLYGPKALTWPIWSEITPVTEGGWNFNGSAEIDPVEANDVYLTRAGGGFGAGTAWYSSLQSSTVDVSFEMEMSGGSGADGITFAFANTGTATTFVGGGGGDLGLVGTAAVAVAFDTASGSRARIVTTTGSSMSTVATYSGALDFRSAPVNVRVKYDGTKLYCWIDEVEIFNQTIAISSNVRLGWTAANGGSDDNHIIRHSSFLPSGGMLLKGERGDFGPIGPGVPAGGGSGQILQKNSVDDFDTLWVDNVTGVPDGGIAGQVLKKNGAADGDILWKDIYPAGGSAGQVLKKTGPNDTDVAWGSGVPAGGTTNQVLKKNSNTDFDAVWAAAPTPVPPGGTSGQVLKKNSATDYDMAWQADNGLIDPTTTKGDLMARTASAMSRFAIGLDGSILTADSSQAAGMKWATPTGWFRGEWVADTIAYDQGFSGGSIPSPFTGSHVGTASDPYIVATSAVGGSASPYTAAVKMQIGNINTGHSSTLTLPLASLGISGITRIKVWTGKTDANIDSSISKNGTAVFSQHQTTYNWTEREFAASSSDTFTFTCFGNYGVNSGTTGGLFVTGIRVYATASPYMTGQFVTYNGKLWKSTQDNNGTTPGAGGATWTEIPLNQMTGVAKDATTTKGDLLVRDSTAIVRLPVGSNGQVLTVDSAQAAGVKWAPAPAAVVSIKVVELSANVSKSDTTSWTTVLSGTFTPTGTSVAVTAGGVCSNSSAGVYANFQVTRDGGAGATLPMGNFYTNHNAQMPYWCRRVFTGLTPGTVYTFSLQVKMATSGTWQCRPASFPNDEQLSLTIDNVV
ncbi:hypothetical protein SEA_CIRCINUS_28 [Streptomyces phage Circinus]|uniref:Minor tail protein n=1 Tax=Streptomyces phage Circinus TaxID=2562189 RepID=A0A4D6E2M5_9CAUD|nr:hypothetical protein SEA_CIRCINUS_28 [Streptomyces phage Circinus]